jgi:hypothetical protein
LPIVASRHDLLRQCRAAAWSLTNIREAWRQAGIYTERPAYLSAQEVTKIEDLVVLSGFELGFDPQGASIADIQARARQLGFDLCGPGAPAVAPRNSTKFRPPDIA